MGDEFINIEEKIFLKENKKRNEKYIKRMEKELKECHEKKKENTDDKKA